MSPWDELSHADLLRFGTQPFYEHAYRSVLEP
jgi:hypothetical protein